MSSKRRIAASRANGAKSRGPQTCEAKRASSQNAIRHGLLAKVIVLPGESRQGFDDLLTELMTRLHPVDGMEVAMVEEMAAHYWRQRRAWAIEQSFMETAMRNPLPGSSADPIANAFRALAASPEMSLLHRYEARLHRMGLRTLNTLIQLRLADLPNDPSSENEQSEAPSESPEGPVEIAPEPNDITPEPTATPDPPDSDTPAPAESARPDGPLTEPPQFPRVQRP